MSKIANFFGPMKTKQYWKSLYGEINDDNVFNGAAALAYYLLLAIFPAMIFLLSILPYLPIENLHGEVMGLMREALPREAAATFESTIAEITTQKRGGLLSVGAVLTLWAASAGLYAIMQQLNITYDVKEGRPFWKARGTAILLTIAFGVLVIGSFALIVTSGVVQNWLDEQLGWGTTLLVLFAVFKYVVVFGLLLMGFALMYYFGPDVKQKFKFVTPGSVFGVVVLLAASLGFRVYVENFGNYSASYGSLGAVIVLMLWLYIAGLVILLGSEVNAMIEHVLPDGKMKGEKVEGDGRQEASPSVLDLEAPGRRGGQTIPAGATARNAVPPQYNARPLQTTDGLPVQTLRSEARPTTSPLELAIASAIVLLLGYMRKDKTAKKTSDFERGMIARLNS